MLFFTYKKAGYQKLGDLIADLLQQQEALGAQLDADYEYDYEYNNYDYDHDGTTENPITALPHQQCPVVDPAPSSHPVLNDPKCTSSYPPVNGLCRNEENNGAALTPYKRLVPPAYCSPDNSENGRKDNPRCSAQGKALPNERLVSLQMRHDHNDINDEKGARLNKVGFNGGFSNGIIETDDETFTLSNAFTTWGQFIIHDILKTPDALTSKGEGVDEHFKDCQCTQNPDNDFFHYCHQISTDNKFDRSDKNKHGMFKVVKHECMTIVRSQAVIATDDKNNNEAFREQINSLTSFIDATTVYGKDSKHLNLLLASDKKRLRMQDAENADHGKLLPGRTMFNDNNDKIMHLLDTSFGEADSNFISANITAANDTNCPTCFVAGDARVNEFPVLTSFHTLFARLHNYVVGQLEKLNPHWCNEKVFNEARLFVIAVNQHITYAEHLPKLLGPKANQMVEEALEVDSLSASQTLGFEPVKSDDPSVRNEFAVAGYRWGHANLKDEFRLAGTDNVMTGSVKTVHTFFDPETIYANGPGACLRGALTKSTGANSGKFWDTFQHNLFKPKNAKHGGDLLTFNIARGREHGVGSYMTVRNFCVNHPVFTDLYDGDTIEEKMAVTDAKMAPNWVNVLNMYESIEDVDLYVGLLYEKATNGAFFGPTNQCINAEQFIALKQGDTYHYTKPDVFPPAQLAEIRKTGLSKVICTMMKPRNDGDDDVVHVGAKTKQDPFNFDSDNVDCENLGGFNFMPWKTEINGGFPDEVHICGETAYNNHNPYNVTYVPKHADGKYIRKHDTATDKYYFQGELMPYFLWYDSDDYNWIISRELFNADSGGG